jgi:hypothetical protein
MKSEPLMTFLDRIPTSALKKDELNMRDRYQSLRLFGIEA